MNELKELIDSIRNDMQDINRMLAARSRELDRRAKFNEEINKEIQDILQSHKS